MDVFLFLYVVGLMVLFFLLGAAIGGAARSFKAYFFGFGEDEVVCGTSREARDRVSAEKAAIGAAALGGGAVAASLQGDGSQNVVVSNDGEALDAAQEWAVQEEPEAVDTEADVTRAGDDVPVDEVSGIEAARPMDAGEIEGDDDYAGAEIFRGVDAPDMADQPAEDVADFAEAAPHEEMQAEEPLATDNENPVSAEEMVDEVPEGVTVSSDVTSSFEAAQHEPGFNELGEAGEAAAENQVGAGEGDERSGADVAGLAGAVAGVVAAADALSPSDEGRMPRPEAAKPVIWGYTSEENNFSDVEFAATGDDQLTMIRGIDEDMEAALKALGVRQFEQIAGLTARQVDFLKSRLGLTTEINTANWIEQATILTGGGLTVFAAQQSGDDGAEVVAAADEMPVAATEVVAPDEEAQAPVEEAEVVPAPAPVPVEKAAPEPEAPEVTAAEVDENDDRHGAAETASLASMAAAEVASRSDDDDAAPQRSSDDGRLFSREERERRDEEWRQRYGGDRLIVPPGKRVSVEDAAGAVKDELEEAESADVAGVADIEQGGTFAGLADEQAGGEETSGDDDGVAPVDSDDLKQIKFISTGLEKKLNLLGVYKLSQIAAWSSADIDEISEQLELKDRIREEGWVVQAGEAMDKGDAGEAGGGFFGSQLVARLEELDQIDDLTEHEKTMLSSKGITSLSQIANWSGADKRWAMTLLEIDDETRVDGWVSRAHSLLASGEGAVPGGTAFGEDDDLKRIRGIDAETEAALKEVGVTSYNQIAAWEQTDMNRINDMLGTAGRVERQYWVVQAKVLRDGGTTDYSKLYDGSSDQG